MPQPLPAPVEQLATILRCLSLAIAGHGTTGRLALPLIARIVNRLCRISQRFAGLAARIGAGRYTPRVAAPRRQAVPRDTLPQKFGWLLKLVPEAVGYRGQFEHLLRDPEMAALIAAAPVPMGRVLRPLCRMFGFRPPPIMARPAPQATTAAAPAPPPPPPSPPRTSPPRTSRPRASWPGASWPQTPRPAPARGPQPSANGPPLPA